MANAKKSTSKTTIAKIGTTSGTKAVTGLLPRIVRPFGTPSLPKEKIAQAVRETIQSRPGTLK